MSECVYCDQLLELYRRTPQTPRDYWLMTEIFVAIHGGDVCPAAFSAMVAVRIAAKGCANFMGANGGGSQ